MIELDLESSVKSFEYDIYSLVKAFYPKEDIKTVSDHTASIFIKVKKEQRSNQTILMISLKDRQNKEENCIQKEVEITEWEKKQDRKAVKSSLKRALYSILSERTNQLLPWGTLTGIRPTKISYAMLEEGKSEKEILNFMKKEYLLEEEKGKLSIEIAKREREILGKIDYKNGYSIYIGIPFCPTRCLYCSFPSYPLEKWKKRVEEYLHVLQKEMVAVSKIMEAKGKKLNTVYLGGGTPTSLEPEQLNGLLTCLKENFDFQNNLELTVEAGRPDSINQEKLLVLKRHGVSRISVNPQTMKQQTLDLIGRHHTVTQTKEAFWLARECGFDNINMDIIVGLPGETKKDMETTMKELINLKPDSITVHSLAIKRASRLNEMKEQYMEFESRNDVEITNRMERYARSIGLVPYYLYRQKNMTGNLENVGYAAPGKAGIYNILIMEEKQTIVALGAGSISKLVYPDGRIERCENVKDVAFYIEKIDEMIERKRKLFED